MIIVSVISAIVTGRVDETVNAVFEGAQTAATTVISLAGALCFWTGLMKISERSGISDLVCRIIAAPLRHLFPNCGSHALKYIAMNITANLFGMGNAATPMGMLAAAELDRENKDPSVPSINMCMLIVINTTAFQLVPTTIIALRAAAGAADAVSVIVPIWIASACAVTVGVLSVKLMGRILKCNI